MEANDQSSPASLAASPPLWLPILAGLPIALCMVVMGLPDLGRGHSWAYRSLFLAAFAIWALPVALVQRRLWQRRFVWWKASLILLAITYVMSLINNAIGLHMAVVLGQVPAWRLRLIFSGLDGCWLALIAFCAIHAVVAYYTELTCAQERAARAMAHAREAELRALRYQLNPHFLFNSLNAISALVASQRNRDANRMIARLGDFLRATLEGGSTHEVTLAEELSLTETYLDVEKARLGHRLIVHTQIGPDVMDALMPYLLLQPLVENAIRHGIAPRTEPGRLELKAFRDGGRLRLEMENEGLRVDRPTSDMETSSAIGLRNVRERLANLYPDDYRIDTRSLDDGGYRVTIDIPLRMQHRTSVAMAIGS